MLTIEAVDFFYLSMPEILDISDGSQDALLVRIRSGDLVGWGECEASPLVTIASLVTPMSHSGCKPVISSVLGERIETPADIARIHQAVRRNSMDLLQADHALSGIDVALWDLLGKRTQQPVDRLLGFQHPHPKTPYCSLLFGESPQETLHKARTAWEQGFRAVKFGWGVFGHSDVRADEDQVMAAREGFGPDGVLCIDAGAVWGSDPQPASLRIDVLKACKVLWLEEPFHTHAYQSYAALAKVSGAVKLAGGEGVHNEYEAGHMIETAGVGFIQVDCGRIGGITSAQRVYEHAKAHGVIFVNHTFTSHLALSASLQVYAGDDGHPYCEYPGQLSPLALELTRAHLDLDANGAVCLPEAPGLGISPDLEAVRRYLVDTSLCVNGKVIYQTPEI